MELNEQWLKIGKIPTRVPVELGSSVSIRVLGEDEMYHFECVKVETKDNQDGSFDKIAVLKWKPYGE